MSSGTRFSGSHNRRHVPTSSACHDTSPPTAGARRSMFDRPLPLPLADCRGKPLPSSSSVTKTPPSAVGSALLRALMPRLFGFNERFGLKSDARVLRNLQAAFGEMRLQDMATRLLVTATDFHTGAQKVFSEGRLVDVIRASIAIPFIFEPWLVEGHAVHDGALTAVPPAFKERIWLFDTARIPSLIEEGARATEAIMPQLRRLLADSAPALALA